MSADMATRSNASLHISQFSGENYQIWTVKMKSYLKAFGLWEYVVEGKQVPQLSANPTIAQMKQHEEEKMKKDKTTTCLHYALSDSVFTSIMHLETSKSIWDELKSRFEGSERVKSVKLLTLKREFENLKMKDFETVNDYSSKLSDLVNQMRLYGDIVEDYKVVEKMLVSLLDKFVAKVYAIEESCDLGALTVSEMVSKLQAQEQRLALRNDGDMEEAFLTMNKGKQKGKSKMDGGSSESIGKSKFPPCSTCNRTNHLSKDCWYKGKPQVHYNYYKKWGHRENFCRSKPNQMQPQPTQQANFTDEQPKAEDHMFMASQTCCSASKDVWYVDSGCTSHMTRDEGMFTTLDKNATTTVKMGNGDIMKAAGKDSKKSEIVRVRMHDNSFPIDFNQVKQKALIFKNDMVRDMQAISRTYDLCDACQIGKLHRKPNMNEDFDGDSSSESGLDDGAVADGKTRSLADVYEKCNIMVNEPSRYEEAAQMGEWKFAMKEELMMIDKNQVQSSAEAKYIAAAAAPNQAIWIRKVLTDLNYVQEKPTRLWCDMSAISMAKNPIQYGRTKHINVKFHAIREAEKNGNVQ
ncbi:hypothetical protein EZV62_018860 [Acer yangbiense]|uniref:Retrovirus-related Pol polyprotein from transposon TNT 1-94-like beta-barrel domain-containing protein n=1 Tax=Acer yangbiense TaxID=1000413 RepID=A0A5C7H9I3_9ROSI|nr:hypothetical protein EZV62_018860 [Acer yangbiense]